MALERPPRLVRIALACPDCDYGELCVMAESGKVNRDGSIAILAVCARCGLPWRVSWVLDKATRIGAPEPAGAVEGGS